MLTRGSKHARDLDTAAGFTLIEVVVSMGIFALLAALTVPTMRTWMSDAKVRAVADALQNGLRLAQTESLRRSRQVVFSLTNNAAPNGVLPLPAVANGNYWSLNTVPSMTDGSEVSAYVQSGVLYTGSTVTVTPVPGQAAICFNSAGRLVANGTTGVTTITGGATCALPTNNPPMQVYQITATGTDHPLYVEVTLAGQVHMCNPLMTLSNTNPDGC